MPAEYDAAIAIVGMSGRFPGAASVDAFWELLVTGRDGVSEAPADRPWMRELYDPELMAPGKVPTTRGGFLPGLSLFDAGFFDISPREACRMDPRLRILLETAYESMEDAGLPPRRLAGPGTGVFMGTLHGEYWLRQIGDLDGLDLHVEFDCSHSALSGRLAYCFDLRGPVLSTDTACASSLTAVHLACAALRAGECQVALAGGVSIQLTPHTTVTFSRGGAVSPDGRCKFGDAEANGLARAEAVGVVVLKPLASALADGDRIRAVILGSAVNNDGYTGTGIGGPTVEGKAELLRAAYTAAGVDPRDLLFVEAHGTGTKAGDKAELQALSQVLGPREPDRRCLVVAAKASVGHTEAAAGVTALIKAALSLEHRAVPGLPFLGRLTPAVDWDQASILLPRQTAALPAAGRLLAGVSAYGMSGTNAHVVLASAPQQNAPEAAATSRSLRAAPQRQDEGGSLLAVSARAPQALRELAGRYADLLGCSPAPVLGEVCAAAALRRDHYECRLALTAGSAPAMAAALRDFLDGRPRLGTAAADKVLGRPRVVFAFPGQGAQWAGMGRELLAAGGPFADALTECDQVIGRHGGFSLLRLLQQDDQAWLADTARVQPALWAMAVALTALWRSWGIEPDAVFGHSQGEIAAAYAAGALSLEASGRVSCLRAKTIAERARSGALCWIQTPPSQIAGLLGELRAEASIAVVESPESAVLAGEGDQIQRIIDGCEERGISCLPVNATYAAHSRHVDPVRGPLLEALADLAPQAGSVPLISTVTGTELPGTALDGPYWWRNLREPVQLHAVVHDLLSAGPVVFLQMSPHPVLSRALQACGAQPLESLRRDRPELPNLYASLAALYAAGCDPDWEQVLGRPATHPDLPRYPWQREHYWRQAESCPWPPLSPETATATTGAPVDHPVEAPVTVTAPVSHPSPGSRPERGDLPEPGTHPMLGAGQGDRQGDREQWLGSLDPDTCAFLLDHRVRGRSVLPGAVHLELGLAVARRLGIDAELLEVELRELLLLDDSASSWDFALRVSAERAASARRLTVASRRQGASQWTDHAGMLLAPRAREAAPGTESLEAVQDRCPDWLPGASFYRDYEWAGSSWQGAFRGIAELWRGDGEALARLRPIPAGGFSFHPAALDACLQAAVAVMTLEADRGFVLASIEAMRLYRASVSGPLWAHARARGGLAADSLTADIRVLDAHGDVIAELHGVRASQLRPLGSVLEPEHELVLEPEHEPDLDGGTVPAGSARPAGQRLAVHWRPVRIDPPSADPGRWVLLGGGALGRALAQKLEAAGCTVTAVPHARDGNAQNGNARDGLVRVIEEASRDGALRGVVDLQATDCDTDAAASARAVQWSATELCTSLLPIALTLHDLRLPHTPPLFVVTQGAQDATQTDTCPAPWQAVLWGLAQTLRVEAPHCAAMLIDLDASPDLEALAALLLAPTEEDRLALRGGVALAARLLSIDPSSNGHSTAIALHSDDGIAGLRLAAVDRPVPGPGQVEIAVTHAPLTFRDVRAVMGGQSAALGLDCLGTVTRIGQGVRSPAVGDRVVAAAHSAMRSHVLADARCALAPPGRLTPAEAAALPVAYGTAYHALIRLADLQPGERVLIHNGTGGLGLAALGIALHRGATVVATAGSEDKRQLLRQLGAVAVADSRNTAFADELRGEDGIDVIFSGLDGDAVTANLSLLAPLGRYLDLAPTGTRNGHPLPWSLLAPGQSYHHIDVPALLQHRPEAVRQAMAAVIALVDKGELAAPQVRVFPAEAARDAIEVMAHAEHIGRVVLTLPATGGDTGGDTGSDTGSTVSRNGERAEVADPRAALVNHQQVAIRPNATYLVTGGVRGVGGLVAEWLVAEGAAHLLLTGRSELSGERAALVARLRGSGAEVEYAAVDVGDERAMAHLVRDRQRRGLPPIAGVVHSAVALEPAPLADMSTAEIEATLHPKVAGGWALHRLFPGRDLDFFVLFSSGISLLCGQRPGSQLGAYAAANTFLDALAAHRHAAGLPATVVNWGYWTGVGLAHRLSERDGHDVYPEGMVPIRPQDAPELFAEMVRTTGRMVPVPADWGAYAAAFPNDAAMPIMRELCGTAPTAEPAHCATVTVPSPAQPAQPAKPADPLPRPLAAAAGSQPSPGSADRDDEQPAVRPATSGHASDGSLLEDWLAEQIARVLDQPIARVDRGWPINRLGVDSLMAAELTTRLRREHGIDTTVPKILKAPSIRVLAADLSPAGTAAGTAAKVAV